MASKFVTKKLQMHETVMTNAGAPTLTLQETRTGDPLLARSRRGVPGPPCWSEAVTETIIGDSMLKRCRTWQNASELRMFRSILLLT